MDSRLIENKEHTITLLDRFTEHEPLLLLNRSTRKFHHEASITSADPRQIICVFIPIVDNENDDSTQYESYRDPDPENPFPEIRFVFHIQLRI